MSKEKNNDKTDAILPFRDRSGSGFSLIRHKRIYPATYSPSD
jgi:hypothetical protein